MAAEMLQKSKFYMFYVYITSNFILIIYFIFILHVLLYIYVFYFCYI